MPMLDVTHEDLHKLREAVALDLKLEIGWAEESTIVREARLADELEDLEHRIGHLEAMFRLVTERAKNG